MKMPALAITDHGNLYGAIEFYQAAKAVNVKPILGCEMYLAPRSRFDNGLHAKRPGRRLLPFHRCWPRDNDGYQNMIQALRRSGFTEGYYYKPLASTKRSWPNMAKGSSPLSGCLERRTRAQAPVRRTKTRKPCKIVGDYQSIFGKDNYYLELMDHGIADQKRQNDKLIELSKKTGVRLVATNDCHYVKKEDAGAHDALLCIGTGSTLMEPNRLKFDEHEFYYKSPEEMYQLFKHCPEAVKPDRWRSPSAATSSIKLDQMLLPALRSARPAKRPTSILEHALPSKACSSRYGARTGQASWSVCAMSSRSFAR